MASEMAASRTSTAHPHDPRRRPPHDLAPARFARAPGAPSRSGSSRITSHSSSRRGSSVKKSVLEVAESAFTSRTEVECVHLLALVSGASGVGSGPGPARAGRPGSAPGVVSAAGTRSHEPHDLRCVRVSGGFLAVQRRAIGGERHRPRRRRGIAETPVRRRDLGACGLPLPIHTDHQQLVGQPDRAVSGGVLHAHHPRNPASPPRRSRVRGRHAMCLPDAVAGRGGAQLLHERGMDDQRSSAPSSWLNAPAFAVGSPRVGGSTRRRGSSASPARLANSRAHRRWRLVD
jgi:hypothetical protein